MGVMPLFETLHWGALLGDVDCMLDDETVMRTDVDCQREQKHRWERHTYAAHDPELHKCAWNPVYTILATASTGPDAFLWRFSGTNDTVDINSLRETATPSESILLKNLHSAS